MLLVAVVVFSITAIEKAVSPIKYEDLVLQYSEEFEVDKHLVFAIIKTESGFNPEAVSNVGARGLMQITEETFLFIKKKIAPKEDVTFDDLFIPKTNIRFGSYLLSLCLARYENDISTAAAAYHSGWGTVDRLLEQNIYGSEKVLTEFPYTQMNLYVKKVNDNYNAYRELYKER